MADWKLVFTGFFIFWGTLVFMRIVGQEVANHRQRVLAQKRKAEDQARMAAMHVPIARAQSYDQVGE